MNLHLVFPRLTNLTNLKTMYGIRSGVQSIEFAHCPNRMLGKNRLSEYFSLPPILSMLTGLTHLHLSGLNLTGNFPTEIFAMSNLRIL